MESGRTHVAEDALETAAGVKMMIKNVGGKSKR